MAKRLVLPGDHLSSAEEAEPGQNTYSDKDEIFSSTMGENISQSPVAAVKTKGRTIQLPTVGMEVYCMIIKASPNKAIGSCIPISEAEGGARGVERDAVLPVNAIRRGYVNDLRDEVKIGDIIRARIRSIEKTGIEITMLSPECGVVAAFCPRCRRRMELHDTLFVCGMCGWKDRRKLPGSDDGSGGEPRERGEWRGRDERPRGGFRPREGGGYGGRPGMGRGRPTGGRPPQRPRKY
jgi:exosome complex component CSL4